MKRFRAELVAFAVLALLPCLPLLPSRLGGQVRDILIFCILALGLNVVVGYAGLLQLGIAAFFGIGAYVTGILTVGQFPFQTGFWPAVVLSTLGAGIAGVVLAAPTLRLRGDYLAIVTLGFGEVVKFAIKNLENITNGSKALNPLPDPWLPWSAVDWSGDYRGYYYIALVALAGVVVLLYNIENSRLGREWMAIREDELAATCMGINAVKAKLSAFALGAALAGLAGSLYATSLDQTGGPDSYTFNRSITVLCFLLIGGMGNIRGALIGTFVLMGYDNVLTPLLDEWIQRTGTKFRFSDVKLIIFGLALILMMRFRPEGIWPSERMQLELHESDRDEDTVQIRRA
ncbi:MAG: branched-chain amino acid ABC transporter permease [Planctomycetes bacterium]|nr:branched-chain amino acid ABC transporter permease [Planctomycetota bacterium]